MSERRLIAALVALLGALVCVASAAAVTQGTVRGGHHHGTVIYPNGLSAHVLKVTVESRSDCWKPPRRSTCLAVLLTMRDEGHHPIPLGSAAFGPSMQLYYGANEYEAGATQLESVGALPQRLVPGTRAIMGESFAVPNVDLKHLALRFWPATNNPDYATFLFTRVETILKGGRR